MVTAQLIQVAVFLAAAAIAAPLGRSLRMGAVLGYLAAGVIIGPWVLGPYYALDDVNQVLQFGEFGVVMLLFVIGLELRPVRLWAMRSAIFGLGTAQLLATACVLAAIGIALGLGTGPALFVGLALALSSTAFALQVLEEKGELTTRHGRLAFSVLLFQDLAAIPLIALVPLFALGGGKPTMDIKSAALAIGTIAGVIVVGRFLLEPALPHRGRHRRARGDDGERASDGDRRRPGHGGGRAIGGARRVHRRRSARRFRVSPSDRSRHRPIRGLLLAAVLHRRRHVDRSSRAGREPAPACSPSSSASSPSRSIILYVLGRWWGSTASPHAGSASSSVRAASSPSCCSARARLPA